jgi:hypothetical protein
MYIIGLFLVLIPLSADISSDCKSKYDLSIYMMPSDRSLYLEGRNNILHAETVIVECDTNIQQEFSVKKHLSYYNTNSIFRAYIGKADSTRVNCKVIVDDLDCDVTNDEYTRPPENYIPPIRNE